MSGVKPVQDYQPGDRLVLSGEVRVPDTDQWEDVDLTEALVIGFDPSYSSYVPSGASKELPPMQDHWHVAVREPETGEWLSAAVYDRNGRLSPHINREQIRNERLRRPRQYTTKALTSRILDLVDLTVKIEKRPAADGAATSPPTES